MALDGCGLFCKYILFIFNLIFAVVGIAFLGLGLWLRFSGSTRGFFEIEELSSSAFVIGVTVLIVLGSLMLIVVSFGDYGACSEKICALQVFSGLVAFMAGLEIVIGVLVYSQSDEVGLRIAEFYSSLYALYVSSGGDPAIGVTLTFIHNALHCCGVTGVKVIEIAQKTCPKPDGFMEHFVMPNCPVTIATVFDSKAPLVMGLFIGTAVLLIIAMICSSTLAKKLRLASSPHYIILTTTTTTLANPSPSASYPDQDPVVFTPLTVANIPVPNIPVPDAYNGTV